MRKQGRHSCGGMLTACDTVGWAGRLRLVAGLLLGTCIIAFAGMKFVAPSPYEFIRIDEFIVIVGIPKETGKVRVFFDDKEIVKLKRASATVSFIPDALFLQQPGLEGPHRFSVKRYSEYSELIEEFSTIIYLIADDSLTETQRLAMVEKGKAMLEAKPSNKPLPFHNGRITSWFEYEALRDTGRTVADADAWGTGGFGDVKYDYNITLRTDEQAHYQTLQRFRGSLSYRSIARLSVGDNWPSYQQSILSQQRVRGLELNLKTPHEHVGLDVVWGRTQEAVKPFASSRETLPVPATHNDSATGFSDGTFGQHLKALRLSFGAPQHFAVSMTVCKITDDTGTIHRPTLIDSVTGDVVPLGRPPADNLVYGGDARWLLFKGKTELFGSFAMSWLTKDISGGAFPAGEMRKYFDPDARIFTPEHLRRMLIVNQTTVPLPLPTDSGETVNGRSLAGAMNWESGIRLNLPVGGSRYRAEFQYFYAGPNYSSLGNPFLTVDRAGWLVNAETRFLDGKVFLKGRVSLYDKDLLELSGMPAQVVHSSVVGVLSPHSNLPSFTLLATMSNEHARTALTFDPDFQNKYYTIGGGLHYGPRLGAVNPSLSLSYYNTTTKIEMKNLNAPFFMRSHTVVADLATPINNVAVEPCASFSLNAATGDVPLTLMAVSAGTRWHVVHDVVLAELLLGLVGTDDPQTDKHNDFSIKAGGRYEISTRNTLWIDAGFKWAADDKTADGRFKLNYELRY